MSRIGAPEGLGISSEFESHVDVYNADHTVSNMDVQAIMGNADSLPDQCGDESISTRSTLNPPKDELIQQANLSKDLGMSSLESQVEVDNEEPRVSSMDVHEVVRDEVADEPNPSVLDNMAPDEATSRKQTHPAKQSKENQTKLLRGKRVAVESRIRKSHPMTKNLAESGTSFDTGVRRSKRIKMRPLEYWKGERFLDGHMDDSLKLLGVNYISPGKDNENLKVKPHILSESSKFKEQVILHENQTKPLRGNRGAVESRIRKSHPMTKNLAESGTSFDTGVRSKRIKMRPLEYWKGERFLDGHVDDSLKLLGVKYISRGKGNENLKVKPYILSESSKY